jgi:DNA polymerase-3 subunit beta
MDVTVPKKDLLRLIARCQGVADKKSTMTALSNILLSVSGPSRLRVAATVPGCQRDDLLQIEGEA